MAGMTVGPGNEPLGRHPLDGIVAAANLRGDGPVSASLNWRTRLSADLIATARERAMLATVADAIIAAAVGKGLCVAVACPDSQVAFVGHLTRALHARGRACRCFASVPSPSDTTRLASFEDEAGDPTVMVITSGTSTLGDGEVCRVSICVTTGAPTTRDSRQTSGGHAHPHHEPDIVLDYHGPSGPEIRHIAPKLSLP
jgi:hypothetical protein